MITGNHGVGKLEFSKLLAKYLKACRILSRDVVIRKRVSDLKDDETKKLLQQGGCLVISLDSLMGEALGKLIVSASRHIRNLLLLLWLRYTFCVNAGFSIFPGGRDSIEPEHVAAIKAALARCERPYRPYRPLCALHGH